MIYVIEHGVKRNSLQFGANLLLYRFLRREILSYVGITEPISLIPHASKVLLEIVRKRLKPYIEANLSQTQAGFRPGRNTVEQIHIWTQLAERYLEIQNGQMVNVFIDFKKAFDRVWHVGMLRVMRHYNIPAKLCSLIESLYD